MFGLRIPAVVAAIVVFGVTGCVTRETHDRVLDERDRLAAEGRQLQHQVEQLDAANTSLSSERERLFDELEDYRIESGELSTEVTRLSRSEAECGSSGAKQGMTR